MRIVAAKHAPEMCVACVLFAQGTFGTLALACMTHCGYAQRGCSLLRRSLYAARTGRMSQPVQLRSRMRPQRGAAWPHTPLWLAVDDGFARQAQVLQHLVLRWCGLRQLLQESPKIEIVAFGVNTLCNTPHPVSTPPYVPNSLGLLRLCISIQGCLE